MDNPIQKGRKKLEEAIREYELSSAETYPKAQGEISYSLTYEKTMRRLIDRESPKKFVFRRCFHRRAAAALLAAAMLLSGMIAVSASKRSEIIQWITKVYENCTEIFFEKRDISVAPQKMDTIYLPTQIPDGYTLQKCSIQEYSAKTVWMDENDRKIILMQNMIDTKVTLDHEDAQLETVFINNQNIVIVKKKEKKCYYFSTSEYAFSLIVPDTLDDTQCLDILFSLQKAEE